MAKTLLERFAAACPAKNEFLLWHIGQHGFLFKFGNTVLGLDLYLTPAERRLIPPPFAAKELTCADIILGTHNHIDHIDLPAWPEIAGSAPHCVFVLPEAVRPEVLKKTKISRDRVYGMNEGYVLETDDMKITALASAHEFLDYNKKSGLYPYLGYVIEAGGFTVYHSGDCCIYEGLQTKLKLWKHFDAVILPVNGRDAVRLKRGCIGCMTYQEAADLAGVLEPDLTIPAHYDMFPGNTCDVTLFTDYMKVKYPALKTLIPGIGKIRHIKKTAKSK